MSNVNSNGNGNGNNAGNHWNGARPTLIKTNIDMIMVITIKAYQNKVYPSSLGEKKIVSGKH